MEIKIQILSGLLKGKIYSFEEYQKISIGRSDNNFFCFPNDKKVSRYHCILEILPPNQFFVQDLDSRNGISIGNYDSFGNIKFKRIRRAQIHNGDCLKVGNNILCISWEKTQKIETKSLSEKNRPSTNIKRGKKIGNFEVIKKLGEGAMGVVYQVCATGKYDYVYAVKIAKPNMRPTQNDVNRFLQEASVATKVKHPNIIRYYNIGYLEEENFFYIVMEYVKGLELKEYLEGMDSLLSYEEAKPLILQILSGIEHLHQNKIIHRDIKPQNIMISKKKGKLCLKIADFGLAKSYEESGMSGLTLSNQAMGTPKYMPPEQCTNAKRADVRADVYSTAATLYYILSKRSMYSGKTKNLLAMITFEEPIPLEKYNNTVPKHIHDSIMKCLAKKAEDRIQSISELKSIVQEY